MFFGSKRHRSPAVSSPSNRSDESRVKRRPLESRPSNVRAPGASKIPPAPNHVGEVMKADAEHLQMMIDGQVVLMRQDDCTINATQILKISHMTENQRKNTLRRLKQRNKVVLRPAQGTHGHRNVWVSVRCGKELCVKHGLVEKLQPLLDHGLDLQQKRSNAGSEKSLVGRKSALRDPANEPEASPFIRVINRSRPVMVRKSDWRINCTHIANQVSNKHAAARLKRTLPSDWYDIVRGASKYQGTYVNFDVGVDWCRELGLNDLADQLLRLRGTENERAVDVQQDRVAPPFLDDSTGGPQAVPVSSRSADSDHNRTATVAGQSSSKGYPEPEGLTGTGDMKTLKNEGSREDDNLLEKGDALSVETDVTQLYTPRSNGSDDDAERNDNQRVEGRTSYYSYGDFEPRNSELKEVNVRLQAPSKTSSRYGSMTDSCSFWLAALDR